MFLVTNKEMADIDNRAIKEWGIPQIVLMENAGLRVLEEIKSYLGEIKGKKITIIAGKGNNGGDGLVVARHLCNQGADVKVFLVGKKDFTGASLTNYQILEKLPVSIYQLDNDNSLHLLKLTLHYSDVLVDAIFGTGFQGIVRGITQKVIEIANGYNCFKVAVDIPSGLDGDTGKALGPCIKADRTVTFALPKVGLAIEPGATLAGEVKVVDIGIPAQIIQSFNGNKVLLTKELTYKYLPLRKKESHKNTYGHLLVIGGSLGMMGAPYLSGSGGFALGAGLVTIVVPNSIQAGLATTLPEAMVYPATETQGGTLGLVSGPEIAKLVKGKGSLVFGPGMGQSNETGPLLKWLLGQRQLDNIPIVVDADGLNPLAEDIEIFKESKSPIIITPHPGEMARILKTNTKEVQENRLEITKELAKKLGIWVVLKGRKTVIATPEGQVLINPTGNPALATAGTGDILAGMIGAMVGQNKDITYAISTAVYIHGLAGQLASMELGSISSKASDILGAIPKAIKKEFGEDEY